MTATIEVVPASRLSRDVRKAIEVRPPSRREARYLVDTYYTMQDYREAASQQMAKIAERGEPHSTIEWFGVQFGGLEKSLKSALLAYADTSAVGRWSLETIGIGPVIAAGLLAHIDIERAPTVGHVWSFAGLNPSRSWEKSEKRPWNAALKTLCWKIGESFVKGKW